MIELFAVSNIFHHNMGEDRGTENKRRSEGVFMCMCACGCRSVCVCVCVCVRVREREKERETRVCIKGIMTIKISIEDRVILMIFLF